MTTTNDWIKMSERKPTEADLPIWACGERKNLWLIQTGDMRDHFPAGSEPGLYWRSAKADIPAPPKEQTQRERDYAVYESWWQSSGSAPRCDSWPAVAYMLAWERAEIAKLLDGDDTLNLSSYCNLAIKLRARLRP